ncbi:FMN-binding domain protein [Thermocrinis albus DSM 14484]|uniref:FMN-binding domain protein n=1 Tax=Thermocrinis albus (strain DSM 14484 / JCM 11386 / HI 11/12) TaxID=638303 RepID=D3SM05_THEAH|nr:FMN-binding protein [Thermocrinis albus]ADC89785.1 FMN-binding domain protein [Thermocrinis albus DSM 14484]
MLILLLLLMILAVGREFKKPEDVLRSIYPGAQVEVKNIILSPQQMEEVKKLSGLHPKERLVSWYIVRRDSKVIAYGYVDTHVVRTHPEVVLYTVTPDGRLDVVEVLAFNEPIEYMPDERWLALFKGKTLSGDSLRLRRDVPNMTGATLTSRAITDNARKVLAMWQVLFGGRR